jgi:hypothetical protein
MDSVVYEMSSSSESAPSIFLRKDWVSIMDNNNASYASNYLTLDTSALSNSNKYMNYRESYLSIPILITATSTVADPAWATAATSADFAFGLKNNYASVIHSIQVDLQGSTAIQQTPFINLYNNFRLLTTFSWQDVANYIEAYHPRYHHRIQEIKSIIGQQTQKNIYPNAAMYSAVLCEILGFKEGTEISLFILARIPTWTDMVANQKT